MPYDIGIEGLRMTVRPGGDPDMPGRVEIEVVEQATGNLVAEGVFVANTETSGHFDDIWVSPGRRRQGVATAVYDFFESQGFAVRPSETVDEDGLLFWDARALRSRLSSAP